MEKKRKTDRWAGFLKEYFSTILTVGSVFCGAVIWVHTMTGIPAKVAALEADVNELKGLPPRVAKVETDLKEMKEQLIENNATTKIILDDTKYIKQVIMQIHTLGARL